jgi:parvulin-like peptidyl-prolyl isomerase
MPRFMCFTGVLLVTSACGGASPAQEPSSATLSPGARCLEDARAERTPEAQAPRRVTVSHILVRHAELADPQGAKRSPEAACLRALAALEGLQKGATWDATVKEYSDSKSSDLGEISREDVTPAFGAAAFELEVNQLSYVVETDRGFHVILRKP